MVYPAYGLNVSDDLEKPKFHYADFHQNFPAGKVADTNHLDMSRCLR